MDSPELRVVPEPVEAVGAAIRHALAAPEGVADGWAEAALVEGVSAGDVEPFQQHDVCSLW